MRRFHHRTWHGWVLAWWFGVCPGCLVYRAARPASLPEGAREIRHIRYFGTPGSSMHRRILDSDTPDSSAHRHVLDAYLPAGRGPHPVILFVHGGSWRSGGKDGHFGIYRRLGRRFAARGFVTLVMSYRLAPDHRHPAQVRDVARAIAWAWRHAGNLGGRRDRIFLMGHSSGAHLIALAVCDPLWLKEQRTPVSAVAGVIAISAPYDLPELAENAGPSLVEPAFGRDREVWRNASPEAHVGESTLPAFLVASAESDHDVLIRQAHRFARALRALGTSALEVSARDRSHYSIVVELGDGDDELSSTIESFVRERGSSPPKTEARAGGATSESR